MVCSAICMFPFSWELFTCAFVSCIFVVCSLMYVMALDCNSHRNAHSTFNIIVWLAREPALIVFKVWTLSFSQVLLYMKILPTMLCCELNKFAFATMFLTCCVLYVVGHFAIGGFYGLVCSPFFSKGNCSWMGGGLIYAMSHFMLQIVRRWTLMFDMLRLCVSEICFACWPGRVALYGLNLYADIYSLEIGCVLLPCT